MSEFQSLKKYITDPDFSFNLREIVASTTLYLRGPSPSFLLEDSRDPLVRSWQESKRSGIFIGATNFLRELRACNVISKEEYEYLLSPIWNSTGTEERRISAISYYSLFKIYGELVIKL